MNFLKRFKRIEIPAQWQGYAKACSTTEILNQKIEHARFVVLDTETTGLDTKKDRILSIGAVGVSNFSVEVNDSFEAVLQQNYFDKASIPIHEITPGNSAQAESAKRILEQFVTYLQGAIIIGHYVDFDYKMLSEASHRNLGFRLLNLKYDTMQLLKRTDTHFAQTHLHKATDLSLDSLCERYHIPIVDRHTAMGDALATALLFARQLKKLEHRGIKTVKDLLRR